MYLSISSGAAQMTMHTRSRFFMLILTTLMLIVLCTPASAQSRRGRAPKVDQFTQDTITQSDAILASVSDQTTLNTALSQIGQLSDAVAARAGVRQFDAMAKSEGVRSILMLINASRHREPGSVAQAFTQSPNFTKELGLLWNDQDNPSAVVRVAMTLMENRPEQVEQYSALAAAICVVHDQPQGGAYKVRINENSPVSAGPLDIFEFFVKNARTMKISPNDLAALNLVYVVDVTGSIEELQWAHDTYRVNPGIRERFFEIIYDYEHYSQGKPKKVTVGGDYSLSQIKKLGGVCADQAYFAMSVAKACGIPSGYVVAIGADVSHAWVGFLDMKGRRAAWDFDAGRYEDYQNLRGNMLNPQTGERTSDGRVGILGSAVIPNLDAVHHAMAAGLVVDRMNKHQWNPEPNLEIELDSNGNLRKPRTDAADDRLELLRATLSNCSGVPSAWDQVSAMAKQGELSSKQLDAWSRAVLQIAGRDNQDFSFDFLSELIDGVEDHRQQHAMWEWAFGQFRTRPDLAAGVRFTQGALWEENGKPDMAWTAYQDVLNNFLNDGPMCVNALRAMNNLLRANNKQKDFLPLLETTLRSIQQPDDMAEAFASQSNFYKVSQMLITEYERHKRPQDAQRIRRSINQEG
tara:strand:- start:124720 stop:126621 length:1902 start_codon:yes stop_codon:yes gene_type:complete